MQASRNTLDRIRRQAQALGVRPAELLKMAREAAHWENMPSLEHLPSEAAGALMADLLHLAKQLVTT